MQYRVETATIDPDGVFDVISDWVEADGLCRAAVVFMLDQRVDNRKYLDPILVVERNTYQMGNYTHKAINVSCDFEVGLRQ
jgi:hypothetical protein